MTEYDIGEVFSALEDRLIDSMMRNMKRHLRTEGAEGLNYAQWQALELQSLTAFREQNREWFGNYFSVINGKMEKALTDAYENGGMEQEIAILQALKAGWKPPCVSQDITGEFFRLNERKLKALVKAATHDMKTAETAMLRMANDQYRKIIFKSAAAWSTGTVTLPQAVDMASRDFLAGGLNCVEYKNGARVPVDTYAQMALRTNQTRGYLLGESVKRDEWGVNTVIVNRRGVACPRCLPFVGKVYYDDVYGSTPVPTPAKYPRLSTAIAGGLYHPNCKDTHTTWFEGVSTPPKPMTQEDVDEANRVYALQQRQRYHERMIRKYKRLTSGSLDPDNQAAYQKKLAQWQGIQKKFLHENKDVLSRCAMNESIHGVSFPEPPEIPEVPILKTDTKPVEITDNGLTKSVESDKIVINEKQFGKKVGKHAIDYGLNPSSDADRNKIREIIYHIVDHADTVKIGCWRGQDEDVLFYICGDDVVITEQNHEFITIMKGGVKNARVEKARVCKI